MIANKVLIIVFLCVLADNFTALGQQTSNPHEFTSGNWDFSERCNPCHVYNPSETPNAKNGFLISYERDSLAIADTIYLSGISKICFTCHDGTIATFGHNTNPAQTAADAGASSPHPVSVLYQAGDSTKTRLYNPNITMSGLGNTIAVDMLKNGRIECTSCHDVHFSQEKTSCKSCPPPKPSVIGDNQYASLLKTNSKSSLCLTCHKI